MSYIQKIELEEKQNIRRSPEVEAERAIAIRDLIANNRFEYDGNSDGPYYLKLGLANHQLLLTLKDCHKQVLSPITLTLRPYKMLVKDYFLICESYSRAAHQNDRVKLETIDMARRGLHNEGADTLQSNLERIGITTDFETARRLFTLICILQIGLVRS